ncbi:alpha/beta hydrolase family protein [Nonomuraea sp. NPDC050663]|uniref:alpha/beta hydrolase family protein n=1 Tax=Nonomuraea sp. NPDC050663 TaxID=3364370 RepID=UPI0037A528DA
MTATTPSITIESGGEQLLGVLHLPAGPGPHPIVVIMHGFPGNERNGDLAQALRSHGYAALVFHYRGSWGVGGTWSWNNALQDALRVTRAVREEGFAGRHNLDPGRLAVVGHSFGAFAALNAAAEDPGVRAVVSIAAFDFGTLPLPLDQARREHYEDFFGGDLLPLRGTSGAALVEEIEAHGWSLAALAPALDGRPVLLIGASRDTVAPVGEHHRPLLEPYGWAERHEWPTDHALSDHRAELIGAVRAFLDRALGQLLGPNVSRNT